MTKAPQKNVELLSPDQFLQATKAKTVKVATGQAWLENQTQTWNLPQAGLLSCLWVLVTGSITVAGTVTSGTWKGYPSPAPFGLIRRMRFGSNNSFNLRDLSGWNWYKWIRYRYGVDPLTYTATSKFSSAAQAAIGNNVSTMPVSGANIATGTFAVTLGLPIPIAYNKAAENGLIVLQTNQTVYSLSIDWGTVTSGISGTGGTNDLFQTLVGTSLVITASFTTTIAMDWYEPINGIDNLISAFMSVNDQTFVGLATGENIIAPPQNDFYTMILMEVINNGLPVAPANLQNVVWGYAGNVYDFQDEGAMRMLRSFYDHTLVPMDGVMDFDLGLRRAQPQRRDTFDGFNNLNVTDLKLRFTLPSSLTLTGTQQVNLVMEALRYLDQ